MDTLTERYVAEVVKRVPESQREGLRDELRATIADTVEARDTPDAEREVLTEMGDPIRAAANYADRPLALIGPKLYPSYIRLLVLLLTWVLPIVTIVLVVLDVVDNQDVGSAIGTAIGSILNVGVQMFGWLTAIFALIDRFSGPETLRESTSDWSPDLLPDNANPAQHRPSNCAGIVFSAFLLIAIIVQHLAQPYWADAQRVPILDPALWSGWIWPVLAGLVLTMMVEILALAGRVWTMTMAVWYAIGEAVFGLTLAWLVYQQQLFNPVFWEHVNAGWTFPEVLHTVFALGVLLVGTIEAFKRIREARQ